MNAKLIALTTLAVTATAASSFARGPQDRPVRPDPQTVVVEMIADYDTDENDALSQTELAAAFAGIRAKHQAARRAQVQNDDGDLPPPPPPPRQGMGRGRGRGPIDPAIMSETLMADFDADSDQSLNSEELYKAISYLHANRPLGPRQRPYPDPNAPAAEEAAAE